MKRLIIVFITVGVATLLCIACATGKEVWYVILSTAILGGLGFFKGVHMGIASGGGATNGGIIFGGLGAIIGFLIGLLVAVIL